MRKKSILSVLIIIVCYSLIISFCSCNKEENPVKPVDPPPPPVQPDTLSHYIWSVHQDNASFLNIYVADTNKIYVIAHDALYIYNGFNLDVIIDNPNYLVKNVYGYDKNNIIAAGFTNKNGIYLPTVFKLTNGNMQTFVFENECNISTDIMITGPNQVWLSSLCESKVYYFDNGNLKTYRLNNNDTIKCGIFYKDQSNNLFVFAHKYPTAPNDTLFTYKLSGNSFELLRTDFIDPYNPNGKNNNISRCGKDAIMLPNTNVNNSQNLYYFNGSEWIVHSYPTDSARQTKIGGISRDSLVALCMPYDDIYTYGSGKWRSENRSVHIKGGIDAFTNIEVKFGNVYLTSCDYFNLLGWIIVGKPNKNTVTKTK